MGSWDSMRTVLVAAGDQQLELTWIETRMEVSLVVVKESEVLNGRSTKPDFARHKADRPFGLAPICDVPAMSFADHCFLGRFCRFLALCFSSLGHPGHVVAPPPAICIMQLI